MLGYILDIVLIAIFVVGIIIGYKKGFADSLFSCLSGIFSLILSFVFAKPFGEWLSEKIFYGKIYSKVEAMFPVSENGEIIITEKIHNLGRLLGVDVNGSSGIKEEITERAAFVLGCILAFILLFIALRIIALVLRSVIKLFTKLPVVHFIDGVAGGLLGAAKSALVCLLIANLVVCVITVFVEDLNFQVERSCITKVLVKMGTKLMGL